VGVEVCVSAVAHLEAPPLEATRALVRRILSFGRAGKKVLVCSLSGLGRSGTLAACVLKQLNLSFEGLAAARGDRRVFESEAQLSFVSSYVPEAELTLAT
jgi:protein-tyrosine phosphatase